MAGERYTFDTNILFYSLDAADPLKHQIARELVGMADPSRVLVMLQTLGELCNSIGRRRSDLMPAMHRLVNASAAMYTVVPANIHDLTHAMEHHGNIGMQFWDAVLWATARRSGCRFLLTEDFQDGRTVAGVKFRNPFTMPRAELVALIA